MHYHWQNSASLIRDVEFYAPHKKEEAVIYAPMGADPEKLQRLADAIRARGFTAQSDVQESHPVLRVGGFGHRQALLHALAENGAVVGEAAQTHTDYDKKKGPGFSTLQLGGAMQVLADMMVMSVALSRGKEGMGDFLASAKWAWAYVMVSLFGKKNPDKQVGYIYKDLKEQMEKSGVHLAPEDAATLAALAEKSGVMPKIERMVRENPILINSLIQISGGASTIQAGLAQKDYNGNTNWWKVAGGSLTASGQLVGGILLDPKPAAPKDANENALPDWAEKQETPHGIVARFVNWIKEKPLRVTGTGSFLSNITRIVSGWVEKKKFGEFMGNVKEDFKGGEYEKRRDALFQDAGKARINLDKDGVTLLNMFRAAEDNVGKNLSLSREEKADARKAAKNDPHTLLCNRRDELLDTFNRVSRTKQAATVDFIANGIKMAANVMIASSSSNIDADLVKTGQLDEVCNFMAHVVGAQPEEKRETTLHAVAAMLASKKGVAAGEPELRERIAAKLEALSHNPWDRRSVGPSRQEETPASTVRHVAAHEAVRHPAAQHAQL